MKSERSYFEDIICAQATPYGASAIAVIRVSGKNCWAILNDIFISHRKFNSDFKSHHVYYGKLADNEHIIDSVVLTVFAENKSFTGEESFEINCHGSQVIVSMIIKLLIGKECRIAEPGEFSKRAFLNGRIRLNEAEAIADIINSSTSKSAMIAVSQLDGRLTHEINEIKNGLADLLAEIEVLIDYPEEDYYNDNIKWLNRIVEFKLICDSLIAGYKRGKFFRDGINAVLLGRTNSGKSTLFNFLLNEDKAIVSDIHGTTRDYIDALINIEGYGVRLYDTAGLRNTDDPIEREGTRRSVELSEKSDMILYLIDGNADLDEDDKRNLSDIKKDKKTVVIINKIDLMPDQCAGLEKDLDAFLKDIDIKDFRIIKMSALKKTGLERFNKEFVSLLTGESFSEKGDPVITNIRHSNLIEAAEQNFVNAREKIDEGFLDLAAFELREALDRLGEITGEITPSDILNRIFDNFCVGK